MDPVLDGTGGGYGKTPGLPVREILSLFDAAAARPSMRSVRSILRLAREQIEARGGLGAFVGLAWFGALATSALGGVWRAWPAGPVGPYAVASVAAVALVLAGGAFTTRHERRANLAQEALIRERAIAALQRIQDDPAFVPDTLDWSERNALQKLARKHPIVWRFR